MNVGSSFKTIRSQKSRSNSRKETLVAKYVKNQGMAYSSFETPFSSKKENKIGS